MLVINNKALKISNKWLNPIVSPEPTPPTPQIPPNTVRVRTSDGNVPIKSWSTTYETATLVQDTSDVYDVYKSGTDFYALLDGSTNVIEVIGINISNVTDTRSMFQSCAITTIPLFDTSNVTNMSYMFYGCSSLTSIPLFNTSNVTAMDRMIEGCSSLTTIPLFDTSKVTSMNGMCYGCTNVESGALALYNQASTQTNPPTNHTYTFYHCGANTTTGSAELEQIPSDWK